MAYEANRKKETRLKHVRVYDQLYRLIQEGVFPAGSQLPSGAGVSRAAVGEPYDAAAGPGFTPGGSSGQKYPRQGELYLRALQLHAAL